MTDRLRHLRTEAGSTLVELLTTVTVLAVGLLGVFTMIDTASSTTRSNLSREGGTTLAREVIERARQLPYAGLADRPSTLGDQLRVLMADAPAPVRQSATSFSVTRRNQTSYAVAVSACKLDSPADGVGRLDGRWCADQPGQSTGGGGTPPGGSDGITLTLLGFPVSATGDVTALACSLLGTNPSSSLLNGLLGRTGASTLNGLLAGGADLRVCPVSGALGGQSIGIDDDPDDLTRVTVTASWGSGARTRSVSQTTLVPNA